MNSPFGGWQEIHPCVKISKKETTMTGKFTPPTTCRICGGTMQAGTLRTTRESFRIPERFPFEQLTSSELWYALEQKPDGKYVMLTSVDGPLMVLHFRCAECGYLESYAQGKYPQ